MTKILITGGTGFVGTYLCQLLKQEQPDAQLILTTQHARHNDDGVQLEVLDLGDAQAVTELIKRTKPDQIYHLASIASVSDSFSQPAKVLQNNFQLTLNLLEALRQFSPQSRLLLVSSADLYDHTDPAPIDENRQLNVVNPYAASKATQDVMGQAYAKSFGLPIIIVRPFNHIGPGQKLGFVVADFASKVAQAQADPTAREIKVGNLEAQRDFTDVRDVVKAYYLLMQKAPTGEIYNLGSGKAVSIQGILDTLISFADVPVKVTIDPAKIRPVDAPLIIADASKARSLGWQPTIPLEQTLRDIFDFWRDIIKKETKTKD
ncbi:GDP-mannose 4,6-dehydratase [bacterium]|nr:GDP-mannose 4,6-dehydratase [bacterium]